VSKITTCLLIACLVALIAVGYVLFALLRVDILGILLDLFAGYGYWVVFFGVMLENAGLPIPGETILLAAGFASALGIFHLPLVMLIAATGAVIGDNIGYLVGRHYGRSVFEKFGRFVLLTPARLARMDAFFAKHGSKTIFVARFITGLRVFAALFAGASRMRWRTFFLYNVAGAIVWAAVIATIGRLFGDSWPILERWIGRSGVILLVVVVIVLVIAWRIKAHRDTSEDIHISTDL
jgi:membrane protein DedA with SNARE-associated domain